MRERIGGFVIECEIGRGGMGVVYRARDERLDRSVAIKTVVARLQDNPARLAAFRREARTIAQLNHPHIAQIHQILEEPGETYLVLEYVPGRSLAELLDAGPLPMREALRVGGQIASAMAVAHDRGIVHRDLKPDNVRVTEDGTAKVLDFGIALASGGEDGAGVLVGTPGYMAPEQVQRKPIDARADMFSFGCVLYECLAGRRAFSAPTVRGLLDAPTQATVPLDRLPPATDPAVRVLLGRCLARERDERLGSMGEALAIIRAALGEPAVTPEPTASTDTPTNLPSARDRFVGRAQELRELHDVIADDRLITLLGIGGCGKTRLATELAGRVRDRFPDGVWFVDLASVADPHRVATSVRSAVRAEERADADEIASIAAHLASERALLVVDNCEHVIGAIAPIVSTVLDAAPDVRILATSQAVLGVVGERVWRVGGLGLAPASGSARTSTGSATEAPTVDRSPETAETIDSDATLAPGAATAGTPRVQSGQSGCVSDAVLLFDARATAARPAFVRTPENTRVIERVCRRLEGIPLAIELAAARVRVLTPEQIEQHLSDRFRLLTGGRSSAERHQTLRAAVDWSYRLLNDAEQSMARRLAAFANGCTLEAAAAVHGGDLFEVLDLLTCLSDKSILVVQEDTDEARYRLLETIREYLSAELDTDVQAGVIRERFVSYCSGVARDGMVAFGEGRQADAISDLLAEHDNLLAAIRSAIGAGDPEAAHGICANLGRCWELTGQGGVGIRAAREALGSPGPATVERCRALNVVGCLAWRSGDLDGAYSDLDASIRMARELGEDRRAAGTLVNLGLVERERRRFDAARSMYEEALSLFEEHGGDVERAIALNNLGTIASDTGDSHGARAFYERCLEIRRDLGDQSGTARVLVNLGSVARRAGDPCRARDALREALGTVAHASDRQTEVESIDLAIMLAGAGADPLRAGRWSGAADAARERGGIARELSNADEVETALRQWRLDAGADAFDLAVRAGSGIGLDGVLSEIRRWCEMA